MIENPYQAPQVISSPHLGLARLLGCAASVNLYLHTWRFNGVSLKVLFLVFSAIFMLFDLLIIYRNGVLGAWIFLGVFGPVYILFALAALKHNIIFTGTSNYDPNDVPKETKILDQLFISGKLVLDETDRNLFQRILNRLMTGRSANHWFVRAPSELTIPPEHPEMFRFDSYLDPSMYFFGINFEQRNGWWNATGKIDPEYQHQVGLLQHGYHAEPAVRFGYFDQRQRRRWIVVSSTNLEYLQATVIRIMHTALVRSQ